MNEMRKHDKQLQKGICDEGQNDLCVYGRGSVMRNVVPCPTSECLMNIFPR